MNQFNVGIGNAAVTLGGTNLGKTKEGAKWNYKESNVELKTDETGETALEVSKTGVECTLELELEEMTQAKLALATGGTISGSTIGLGGKPKMLTAQELIITPEDGTGTITIHRAVVLADTTLEYSSKTQRSAKITLKALYDSSKTAGQEIGTISFT